jgi:vanillate/3-O-methylgallate O-demethylase
LLRPGTRNVGDELTLVWSEEGGGTRKTTVGRHRQAEIRVTVGPVPYAAVVRAGHRQPAAAS